MVTDVSVYLDTAIEYALLPHKRHPESGAVVQNAGAALLLLGARSQGPRNATSALKRANYLAYRAEACNNPLILLLFGLMIQYRSLMTGV
jgi:hypothetical protein